MANILARTASGVAEWVNARAPGLMPATARRFGVVNAYDPEQNIRGGQGQIAVEALQQPGEVLHAAAGYNAGEGAVARHKGVPPYAETQRYVVRVGTLAERYRGQLASR